MRGLVISPEYRVEDNGGIHFVTTDIDSLKLREYLLYWDKLDFPNTNIVSMGTTPETDYLESVGVLQRSVFNSNTFNGEFYAKIQLEALKKNNEKEKGSWSLAQPNSKLVLDKVSSHQTRNLEVELYRSLPIPSAEVSLDDILSFKEIRKDELLEFRSLMDGLYLEVIASGDPDRAKMKSIEQIQRKIVELNRVMDEANIKSLLGNLKVEIDVSKMFEKTLQGAGLGALFHFPVGVGAALGFASSFIQVKTELSLKPKEIPEGLKDYAYLYYTNKELT